MNEITGLANSPLRLIIPTGNIVSLLLSESREREEWKGACNANKYEPADLESVEGLLRCRRAAPRPFRRVGQRLAIRGKILGGSVA